MSVTGVVVLLFTVTLVGLKVQVTVAGWPAQAKLVKAPVQPLAVTRLMVSVVLAPAPTEIEVAVAAAVKLGPGENVAVTASAADMTTVHTFADPPTVQPDQLVNTEPLAGVAVRVTVEPGRNPAEQVEPQLMDAGLSPLTTVPLPVPALVTVSVLGGRNAALTVRLAEPTVTEQVVPVEVVQPVQPLKVELLVAAAVSVTTVPDL